MENLITGESPPSPPYSLSDEGPQRDGTVMEEQSFAAPSDWVNDPASDAALTELGEAAERGEFAAEVKEALRQYEANLPPGQRLEGPPWRIVEE